MNSSRGRIATRHSDCAVTRTGIGSSVIAAIVPIQVGASCTFSGSVPCEVMAVPAKSSSGPDESARSSSSTSSGGRVADLGDRRPLGELARR